MNNNIIGYDPMTGKPIYGNQTNVNPGQPQAPYNGYNLNGINQQQSANNNFYNNTVQQPVQPLNSYSNTYQNTKTGHNKKKLFIGVGILLALIVIILTFVIISGRKLSRTIMIYMVGSDLESRSGLASVDLNAINYNAMDNENINVVLIAGGSKKWRNDFIDTSETSIYELTATGFEEVKSQNIKNMGDSRVLTSFLDYVYENYETDEYDLIFWNHGAGILGAEIDEISGDLLNLSDLNLGLSSSKFNENHKKIETVVFRTCLNGTVEVANIFAPYARYFVASEEVTVGSTISNVLSFINNIEPTDDAVMFGKKFIESYKNQIENIKELYKTSYGSSSNIYSTYSVVDLSKLDKLENSINEFFGSINVSQDYNKVAKVRSNLLQYASDAPYYDMVDLYNLVDGLKELSPSKAEKLLANLEDTIVYNWATNPKSRGLSIYFPYNGDKEDKKDILGLYDSFDMLDTYSNFISNFVNIQTSSYRNYSFSGNKTDLVSSDEEADFSLELTDEQLEGFAKAKYLVFRTSGDGYYMPVYNGGDVTLDGDTLKANVRNKQLKVVGRTNDGIEENVVISTEKEVTEDTIEYETIVILEDFRDGKFEMDPATMRLVYDKKKNKTTIGGVFLNSSIDKTPNGALAASVDDYQYIVFASSKYHILDENGNYTEDWESNGVIEGIEVEVDEMDFDFQGYDDEYEYYCVFRIYDVDNNYYYSKLIKMN